MKKLIFLLLIALVTFPAFSQNDHKMRTARIINVYREKSGLPELVYKSRHQFDLDLRSYNLTKKFQLSDSCNECTGEVIAKGETYKDVLLEITDQQKGWEHFKKEATGICVGIYKTDSLYYAVVLTY